MGHGVGVNGNHQLHRLHLAGGLHVAQDAGEVWGELLICSKVMASGQMPSRRLMRRLMELRLKLKARASVPCSRLRRLRGGLSNARRWWRVY
jgi:hypothetical protein